MFRPKCSDCNCTWLAATHMLLTATAHAFSNTKRFIHTLMYRQYRSTNRSSWVGLWVYRTLNCYYVAMLLKAPVRTRQLSIFDLARVSKLYRIYWFTIVFVFCVFCVCLYASRIYCHLPVCPLKQLQASFGFLLHVFGFPPSLFAFQQQWSSADDNSLVKCVVTFPRRVYSKCYRIGWLKCLLKV